MKKNLDMTAHDTALGFNECYEGTLAISIYEKNHEFFRSDKGERVLQPSHRGHASQSNDSKTPVCSGKGMSDDFQYNFLH